MKTLQSRLDNGVAEALAIKRELEADKQRNKRLNKRVKWLISFPRSYFITFTLKEEHLGRKMSAYSKRLLKALEGYNFVWNEDYGSENERLHFHVCLGSFEKLNYKVINERWRWGAVNYKKIIKKDHGSIRRYMQKIANHARKGSAGKLHFVKAPLTTDQYSVIFEAWKGKDLS